MARKKLSEATQREILVSSRRRCVICYGLYRDVELKSGQIAHLDQDSSNNDVENLAFMCMNHHDEYDSITRQRKNFTLEEVKQYRRELYIAVMRSFDPVPVIGYAHNSVYLENEGILDHYTGHYIMESGVYSGAELLVTRLLDGRFHVAGHAIWGGHRPGGPNLGDVDFVAQIQNGKIEYRHLYITNVESNEGETYNMSIEFTDKGITVKEVDFVAGFFGINVTFEGSYIKIGKTKVNTQ